MTNNTIKAKPILAVDIDGVANAFDAWHKVTDSHGKVVDVTAPAGYREEKAGGYWLLIPELIHEWMEELESVFDARWGTMWQHQAWVFGAAAGFGANWNYIDFDQAQMDAAAAADTFRVGRTGAGVGAYKHPGILAAAGDQPFAWIDDDATDEQMRWAADRNAYIPTLIVRPDPAVGMTREHVDRLLTFAQDAQEWLDASSCATI